MSVERLSFNRPSEGDGSNFEVAIFWDYENVPLPDNCHAVEVSKCIQIALTKYGRIVERRLYSDSRKWNAGLSTTNRRSLDASGFNLVDTPSKGGKEVIDKKIIADILTFAWDSSMRCIGLSLGGGNVSNKQLHGMQKSASKPCVVLITSDGDYAYALSKLRDRGVYSVVFYGRDSTVSQMLVDTADDAYSFEKDILASIIKRDSTQGYGTTRNLTSASLSQRPHDHSLLSNAPGMVPYEINPVPSFLANFSTLGDVVQPNHQHHSRKSLSSATEEEASKFITEEDVFHFCEGVHLVQATAMRKGIGINTPINDYWATDLHVGGHFKKFYSNSVDSSDSSTKGSGSISMKQRYQHVRSHAISRGFVEPGRRIINATLHNVKEIVAVQWDGTSGKGQGLSSEVYLRLTDQGTQYYEQQKKKKVSEEGLPEGWKFPYLTQVPVQDGHGRLESESFIDQQFSLRQVHNRTASIDAAVLNADTTRSMWPREDFVQFASCIKKLQNLLFSKGVDADPWVSDAAVADHFRQYHDSKPRYKEVRDIAISHYRIAKVGRRNKNLGVIEEVNWCENAGKGEGLSDEFYLMLTIDGEAFTKSHKGVKLESIACVDSSDAPSLSCRNSSTGLDSGDKVSVKSDSTRLISESSLSLDEGVQLFCESVQNLQPLADKNFSTLNDMSSRWVADSTVASLYRSRPNSKNIKLSSKDYKASRERAIRDDLVQVGRRVENTHGGAKKIIPVDWHDNAGRKDGLASEVYLRLSATGNQFLLCSGDQLMADKELHQGILERHETDKSSAFGDSCIVMDRTRKENFASATHTIVSDLSSMTRSTSASATQTIIHDQLKNIPNDSCSVVSLPADLSKVNEKVPSILKRPRTNPDASRMIFFGINNSSMHYISDQDGAGMSFVESEAVHSESAHEFSDASIFLQCIMNALSLKKSDSWATESWATDSSILGLFTQEVGHRTQEIELGSSKENNHINKRYQLVRNQSIQAGFVEAGRGSDSHAISRVDNMGDSDERHALSEIYLRLTDLGVSNIATSELGIPKLGRFRP